MWKIFVSFNVMWLTSGGAGLTRPQPKYYEQPESLNLKNEKDLKAETLIIPIHMHSPNFSHRKQVENL